MDSARFGTIQRSAAKHGSFFIAKQDPQGRFLWVQTISLFSEGFCPPIQGGLRVDCNGNIYFSHVFRQKIQVGRFVLSGRKQDILGFVAKFDPSGKALWAKPVPFPASAPVIFSQINGLVIDSKEQVTIGGNISCGRQFGNPQAHDLVSDAIPFLAQYDPTGRLLWYKQPFQQQPVELLALAIDANDDLLTTGRAKGPYQCVSSTKKKTKTLYLAFVAKFDKQGNALWSQTIASPQLLAGRSITSDPKRNIYVTGYAKSSYVCTNNGSLTLEADQIFTMKLNTSGAITWLTNPMKVGASFGTDISWSPAGKLYALGSLSSTQAIKVGATTLRPQAGLQHIFLMQLDPQSGQGLRATMLRSDTLPSTPNMSIDPFDNVHVQADFFSSLQMTQSGQTRITSRGNIDIALWKEPTLR